MAEDQRAAQEVAEADAQRTTELEEALQAEADCAVLAKQEAATAKAAQAEAEKASAAAAAALAAEQTKEEEHKQMRADRKAERKAERRERRAAAAAVANSDSDTTEGVEVTNEAVTEENSRSSDEKFATTVTGEASSIASAIASAAVKNNDDDDGLSKFEKALLFGLGAVVVGNILDNGDEVVSRSGDRVVVERDGELRVLKNDDALLRQPGANLRTETFNDGSTRNTVVRHDGSSIVTIRAADGRVLSRTRITQEGEAIVIFDDTQPASAREVTQLPEDSGLKLQTQQDTDLLRVFLPELACDNGDRFSLQ